MTTALVTVIGSGVEQKVQDEFKTLNVSTLFIFPDGKDPKLSTNDTKILEESPYVTSVSASIGEYFLVSNSLTTEVETYFTRGVKESYFEHHNVEVDVGDLISDGESTDKIAVIWSKVFEDLFDNDEISDALWETITLESKKYHVIWVLNEVWQNSGPDFDDVIFLPIWTTRRYLIKDAIPAFTVLIDAVENMNATKQDITKRLRKEHKLKENDPDGFRFFDGGEMITTYTELTAMVRFLLLAISVFILIVSGVGIMNVMFAGVAERTKEIWILKSIWATKKDIQSQFMTEAILITLFSGILGLVLAEVIITIAMQLDLPVTLSRSFWWDVMALGFACLTGVFAGWYPAVRASSLDPVDALRS